MYLSMDKCDMEIVPVLVILMVMFEDIQAILRMQDPVLVILVGDHK
jgi:hypothetical protein